jgi:hypothetical protein
MLARVIKELDRDNGAEARDFEEMLADLGSR